MIYRLYLNKTQISHAPTVALALSEALNHHDIHPKVVAAIVSGATFYSLNGDDYSIVKEPALTSLNVQTACESAETFGAVLGRMESELLSCGGR